MLLDKNFRRFVVAIFDGDEPSSSEPIGSGFLYAVRDTGVRELLGSDITSESTWNVWLVTAKHVLENQNVGSMIQTRNSIRVRIYVDLDYVIDVDDDNWYRHTDADVAVYKLNYPLSKDEFYKWAVAGQNDCLREEMQKYQLEESQQVVLMGFPYGWAEVSQDDPVVRLGAIAQIQGWFREEMDYFLVDGHGFPGMSGGPVVSIPDCLHILGEYGDDMSLNRNVIVGMISERTFSQIEGAETSDGYSPHIEESGDLVRVVPMDTIFETIQMAISELM